MCLKAKPLADASAPTASFAGKRGHGEEVNIRDMSGDRTPIRSARATKLPCR
jgi:hypothetical protein